MFLTFYTAPHEAFEAKDDIRLSWESEPEPIEKQYRYHVKGTAIRVKFTFYFA